MVTNVTRTFKDDVASSLGDYSSDSCIYGNGVANNKFVRVGRSKKSSFRLLVYTRLRILLTRSTRSSAIIKRRDSNNGKYFYFLSSGFERILRVENFPQTLTTEKKPISSFIPARRNVRIL